MVTRRYLIAMLSLGMLAANLSPAWAIEEGKFERATFEAAQAEGKPILLHVAAVWCEICQAQKAVIEELEGDARFRDYAIYTIDYDSEKDIMRSFGVTSRSTMIVFKGKTETGRLVGDTDKAVIESLLEKGL